MPGTALGQGQIVSLAMLVAGLIGLLVGVWPTRARRATATARARSALVDALLITAGLALLLVRRLDPAALFCVLADLSAALAAGVVAERARAGAARLGGPGGRRAVDRRRPIPVPALRKEWS